MRVVIVATFLPPHIGGLEVVAQQQAETLAASGHDVVVLTSRHDRRLPRQEVVDGYRVVRAPVCNALEDAAGIPFPLVGLVFLVCALRLLWRADVVHVHDVFYQPCWLVALLAWAFRVPLFVTQHVAVVDHPRRIVVLIQRLIYRTVGRRVWRAAAAVIAYNVLVTDHLARHGVDSSKVRLTYNGVDTSLFVPATPAEKFELRDRLGLPQNAVLALFVGRLVPKKGLRVLVDAADPTYQLICVGPGRAPGDVPAGMCFPGPKERQELVAYYRACDIFVFPAVGEMFTLVMQEAMASGLPVVTTNEPAYHRYDLDLDGIVLVAPESEAVRAALRQLAAAPARRAAMGACSRALAEERFDWDRNQRAVQDLYRRATDRPL